ncbi:2'-5' RNA ligase family protein [Streptomyces roseoverticillatus]|uniref:2'-5' RNA ligase family protein n=1 Tax=Streptomyces roseoverticillatus TaxID=66429 RepID=UPI0033FC75CF
MRRILPKRGRVRPASAIADFWPQVPEAADGFAPHVSIAYSNAAGPAEPVADALTKIDAPLAHALIQSVELIELHRDRHIYEWRTRATVPLQSPA